MTHSVERLLSKYPDKVPIILERGDDKNTIPDVPNKKFLVPRDITVGQFIHTIRRRIQLDSTKAIYLFFGKNQLPCASQLMGQVYEQFKNQSDGILYGVYTSECTFG